MVLVTLPKLTNIHARGYLPLDHRWNGFNALVYQVDVCFQSRNRAKSWDSARNKYNDQHIKERRHFVLHRDRDAYYSSRYRTMARMPSV